MSDNLNNATQVLTSKGLDVAMAWHLSDVSSLNPDVAKSFEFRTLQDIVVRLIRWGSLSDKQFSFLGNLCSKLETMESDLTARRNAKEAARPVPSGRVVVKGKVLSVKGVDTAYGFTRKMLVESMDGFKVYGTVPTACDIDRGMVIEFVGTCEPSKDDSKFGFFSRPAKLTVIESV